MNAKIGQIVSPNSSQISMMSSGIFRIESYVPEVYIPSIARGNMARTTLDAYGPDVVFDSQVISIDPAETIRDGVSTYKVTLQLANADERIRSGMTANTSITTYRVSNAIVIPQGCVQTVNNSNTVKVVTNGRATVRQVQVAPTPSLGKVQIVSGLNDGDIILIDPSQN
jgi:multidrug efflux pump subunit AcrA (membrane-fusion protein)